MRIIRLPVLVITAIAVVGVTPSITAQSAQSSTAQSPEPGPIASKVDPLRHLSDAEQQLAAAIKMPLLTGENKTAKEAARKMTQLREDFAKLASSYRSRATSTGPAASNTTGETPAESAINWNHRFSDVERDLAGILGGGSLLTATSITAVGTVSDTSAGTAANPSNVFTALPGATNSTGQAANGGQPANGAAPSAAPAGNAPSSPIDGSNAVAGGAPTGTSSGTTSSNPTGTQTTPAAGASSGASRSGTGTGTATGAGTGTGTGVGGNATGANGAAVVGLAGVAMSDIGVKNLDPRVRTELEKVRTNVELFYDAATRVGP